MADGSDSPQKGSAGAKPDLPADKAAAKPGEKKGERRAFRRREAKGNVFCRPDKYGMSPEIRGEVIDLTMDGCLLEFPKQFEKGKEIQLRFDGVGSFKGCTVGATIRKVIPQEDAHWQIGCQFSHRIPYQDFVNLVK